MEIFGGDMSCAVPLRGNMPADNNKSKEIRIVLQTSTVKFKQKFGYSILAL